MSKKKQQDPFAAREASKYTDPIVSREYIISHLFARKDPAALSDLIEELGLSSPDAKEALRRRLKAMLRDGQLEQLSKRRYWPSGKRIILEGVVHIDKKNISRVYPTDGSAKIELASTYYNNQLSQGNKVIVSVPETTFMGEPRQGKIVEILEQLDLIVTGSFVKDINYNYVIPHSKEITTDILIPKGEDLNADDGLIVVIEVKAQTLKSAKPTGKIIEILGDKNSKGIEIEAAIRTYKLPHQWPVGVQEEIKELKDTNDNIGNYDKDKRLDLRKLPFVTIDGEDARDFDDAVYCEPKASGGWKLFVAIADVSFYVKADTALDQEASVRGNSVYFPARVIPMLPEVLSNNLCSLKPKVDRLCLVCEMSISNTGKLTRYNFHEAIMHSHARLTYNKVAKILDGDQLLCNEYSSLLVQLKDLESVYQALYEQRQIRGAIDFETVETRILFGKNGKISTIEPVERNIAHRIIEESMLCANVATAKFLDKHKIPGLYRNHEGPPADKLSELLVFLKELGLSIGEGKEKKLKPLDYGSLLQKIKHRPDANIIQKVLLRSLSQAVYAPDNLGHFGLAYPAYTHFTSPIRRYPDLIVHRQIRKVLQGQEKIAAPENQLADIAAHCSITERRADDATRDVIMSLKCQYMHQHLGKTFTGVVSCVTRFGLFVELDNIYIDGLVHITNLDNDYFIFDQVHHKLVGERTGIVYTLGTKVTVCVAKVSVEERKIDFTLISQHKAQKKPKKKISKKTRK